jgi:hypothetical protein
MAFSSFALPELIPEIPQIVGAKSRSSIQAK